MHSRIGAPLPSATRLRGMTTNSKTVAFIAFPLWIRKQINGLACGAGEQTFYLLPDCYHYCRIDRRCRFAVVLPEAMGVDAQGDCRRGVAKALADGRYVHAGVDQL
jgi:hypothetical protein